MLFRAQCDSAAELFLVCGVHCLLQDWYYSYSAVRGASDVESVWLCGGVAKAWCSPWILDVVHTQPV